MIWQTQTKSNENNNLLLLSIYIYSSEGNLKIVKLMQSPQASSIHTDVKQLSI